MNIYEISEAKRKALNEMFDPETGEVIPEKEKEFEALEGSLNAKAMSYCYFIKEYRAQVDAIIEATKGMIKRAKSYESKAQSMEDRIKYFLDEGANIENEHHKIKWNRSESVRVINENKPVRGFMVSKTVFAPDKNAIKLAIKSGKKVDNAEIEVKQNITIK